MSTARKASEINPQAFANVSIARRAFCSDFRLRKYDAGTYCTEHSKHVDRRSLYENSELLYLGGRETGLGHHYLAKIFRPTVLRFLQQLACIPRTVLVTKAQENSVSLSSKDFFCLCACALRPHVFLSAKAAERTILLANIVASRGNRQLILKPHRFILSWNAFGSACQDERSPRCPYSCYVHDPVFGLRHCLLTRNLHRRRDKVSPGPQRPSGCPSDRQLRSWHLRKCLKTAREPWIPESGPKRGSFFGLRIRNRF